jgi:F0F1-type ATP synthase membrane subunit b/b'
MKRIIKFFILTIELVIFFLLLGYHYYDPLTKFTKEQVKQMKLITLYTKYNIKPEGLEN